MTKKLCVLVDLDDVLWNLVTPWVENINRLFGTNVKAKDITDWEIAKFFPTLSENDVYIPLFNNDLWINLEPVEDGVWFITKLLEDGHKVKIVTSTFYQNVPIKMEKLFECYPMIKWKDVTVTTDKQSVKGDVLIDDGIHNLVDGDYHKILMDRPHNKYDKTLENGITRVFSLKEAYEVIKVFAC